MKKSYLRSAAPQKPILLLVLEHDVTSDQVAGLKQHLLWVKRRFSLQIHLFVATPDLLFNNAQLYSLLRSGLFSKVQISGEKCYFYYDMLELCKRQSAELFFFCAVEFFAQDFFNWLAFFIRHCNVQLAAEVSTEGPQSVFSLAVIREVPAFFAVDLSSWQQAMVNPILRHRLPPKDASGASAVFLTLPGVDRLGGIDKFTQRQLSIGGRAVQTIDNFYCLASEHCVTVADNLILLPFFERVDDGDVLLFDINPAYSEALAEQVTATVNVPRTILLITKVANLPERLENFGSTSASFVMSCFNKVHYLAAAWYSVVMQTYQNIELTFLDDGSSDTSVALIKELSSWTVEPFRLHINCFQHHGTYWLRNFLINKKINESVIYLVQDADDYSTAQRALLQVNLIQDQRAPVLLLLADIVRTDSQYRLLELDGELERYGSATLAADVQLHRNYGYFEHLRKNADTEFINRIKRFGGEAGLRWFRYPVLFQPYDGNNLTADIYTFNDQGTRLAQNIEARTLHKELFNKHQRGLKLHQLTDEYGFPAQVFPGFYYEKLAVFLLDKFLGFSLVTAIDLQAMLPGLIDDNAGKQLDDGRFKFTLHKKNQEHSYFYSTTLLPSSLFYQQQLPDSQRVALSFEADVVGQANLVLVYLDTEKNKLSHQFFYVNQVAVVQLPPNASWVRLGVKLTGEASMTLNRIEIGWMVTSG